MNGFKLAFIHLWRNKVKTLVILLIMTLISALLMTTILVRQAAVETTTALSEKLMTTVSVSRDEYNGSLYDLTAIPRGEYEAYYTGPQLTQDLYDTIMGIEGVVAGNWEQQNPYPFEFSDSVSLVAGRQYKALETGDYSMVYEVRGPVKIMLSAEQINCYANDNTQLNNWFTSGAFELIDGRHIQPDDKGVIVVSAAFAQLNGLSVGDELHIGVSELFANCQWLDETYLEERTELLDPTIMDERDFLFEYPVKIVGIYSTMLEESYSSDEFEENKQENTFFIDSSTSKELSLLREEYAPIDLRQLALYSYSKMTFQVADPAMLDTIIAQAQTQMPGSELLAWRTNSNSFAASTAPLEWMQNTLKTGTFIVMGGGVVLLILVLLFWTRSRRREVAVQLSMGIRKRSILLQLITEACVIALIAVLIGTLPSIAIGRSTEEKLLVQGVEQSDQEELLYRSTSIPADPLMYVDQSTTYRDYTPDQLTLRMTPACVITALGIMLAVSITTMLIANIPSMTLKPKDLLSQKQ